VVVEDEGSKFAEIRGFDSILFSTANAGSPAIVAAAAAVGWVLALPPPLEAFRNSCNVDAHGMDDEEQIMGGSTGTLSKSASSLAKQAFTVIFGCPSRRR